MPSETSPAVPSFALRYLSSLPRHLDSYPECQASVDVPRAILTRYPELAKHPKTPMVARRLLEEHPLPKSGFVPEVHCMFYVMVLRDTYELSDDAVVKGAEGDTEKLMDGPILRPLLRVMSPTLVAMGAHHTWGKLHKGSTLTVEKKSSDGTLAKLSFPPHLFNHLMLRCFAAGWQCAIARSRASSSVWTIKEYSPTSALFEGTWSKD